MASALEEKDAIRELLAEYCFRIDSDRFAELAALFTADGTWDTAFGKATGRPGIEALLRQIAAQAPERPRRIHQVSNVVIRLEGERAEVLSNWVVVQNSPQGPKLGSGGSYTDELVKQDGHWLFRYRKIDRYVRD
jgi:uncharacterized protein (TIGR02246 family)